MLTVVIALISFAVAFVCGGVLSKAYFATRNASGPLDRNKFTALLQAQRIRYRKRMAALNSVIRRHEEVRNQVRDKLTNIEREHAERGKLLQQARARLAQEQQQLADRDCRIEELTADNSTVSAIEEEFGVLRIERDELAARIRRMEAEQVQNTATTESSENETIIARMRADMGELRETLATRNRRVHDLELRLQDSTERARQLQAKLDNWKQRVTPLTRKLKQQKEVIQKFCHSNDTKHQLKEPGDDLKAIHGIGPVLERRLQQHGIRRYRQIAEMTAGELADIARKLAIAPNLAERDAWIQQARDLQKQAGLCQTA